MFAVSTKRTIGVCTATIISAALFNNNNDNNNEIKSTIIKEKPNIIIRNAPQQQEPILNTTTTAATTTTTTSNNNKQFFNNILLPTMAKCEEQKFTLLKLPETIDNDIQELLIRYQTYILASDLKDVAVFKKEKDLVKIYTACGGHGIPDTFKNTGLPTGRIGETIINAPIEDVANCWWYFNGRKNWDKLNVEESQLLEEYSSNRRLVYFKGFSKKVLSARDFVFFSTKIHPPPAGAKMGTQIYVQSNGENMIPEKPGCVRGSINTMMIFEPIDAVTTKVRYVTEGNVKGWIPTAVVELAADDLCMALAAMRKHLEKGNTENVDQAVKIALERKKDMEEHDHDKGMTSGIDGLLTDIDALKALLEMLNKKLKQLKKDEKEMGLDLSDLRKKIEADIRKTEMNLRKAEK